MIGCLTETTTCVVAKPLVYMKEFGENFWDRNECSSVVGFLLFTWYIALGKEVFAQT